MIYLILAVISGSLFSVIFKFCQKHGTDTRQVILFNYLTAIAISLFNCRSQSGLFTSVNGLTLVLTAFQGILFLLGFIVTDWAVRKSGIALTTVSTRTSLIIPVLLSWIFLGQEIPSWITVILVLIAMAMIILPGKNAEVRNFMPLITIFLVYGIADFSLKLTQHMAGENIAPAMLLIFVFAFSYSLIFCIATGSLRINSINPKSIIGGVVLGISNTCATAFTLHALKLLPAGTYFPLYNTGVVITATFIGIIFYRERLNLIQTFGFIIAVAAICLHFWN